MVSVPLRRLVAAGFLSRTPDPADHIVCYRQHRQRSLQGLPNDVYRLR
jgi:hypothetical protein